ncbi:TPA: hypothetical protein ACH3X2_009001 [Trebouxia sp. C0005]
MHLVTGGGEKQLAGIMMQAEADLDELIVAYSESMVNRYKVVGASTGLAIHLWAIIQEGYLPALMSDLVPAAFCAVAIGLLGLDLTLPRSPHAQEVPVAAHDLQQIEEAITLAAAPRPAALTSSAAAAAASPPIAPAQSDINSASAPTVAAAAAKGFANVDAAGAAVSISSAADADAAAPGSSLCIAPAVDHAAANPAAALPAVGPAAARPAAAEPAVDMLAVDPAAAKPAVSNPTATDAASDAAPASGGCAAAAAPRSAQIGTEPKPVNGSSKGISAGDYEVVPVADYLEQLKDPHKRRLSDGATSVVNLRVDPYHLLGPFCIHVRCAVGQHILVFRQNTLNLYTNIILTPKKESSVPTVVCDRWYTSASSKPKALGDCMFGPSTQQIDQIMKLPTQKEQDRLLRKAIQEEQALWAKSKVYHAASKTRPHQLMALPRAAAGLTIAMEIAQMEHVDKLLSAMLHPEVGQQMTAEEMEGLQWLQEAAAVPLTECPLTIRQLQRW